MHGMLESDINSSEVECYVPKLQGSCVNPIQKKINIMSYFSYLGMGKEMFELMGMEIIKFLKERNPRISSTSKGKYSTGQQFEKFHFLTWILYDCGVCT